MPRQRQTKAKRSSLTWSIACLAPIMAGCAAISGCGGGGSSLCSPSSPPASIAPAAAGHAARINELRGCAGLAPLSWNGSLAAAAQARSSYLAANGEFGHSETPGAPLYYASVFSNRMAKEGFPQLSGAMASETLVGGSRTPNIRDETWPMSSCPPLSIAWQFWCRIFLLLAWRVPCSRWTSEPTLSHTVLPS